MLLMSGLGELYEDPSPGPEDVLDIIKWTHVYDRIDKAFNRAWQLAKAIEGLCSRMPEISLILVVVIGVALVFDFTNGAHDTANAIATVVSPRYWHRGQRC